jgi:prophage regulatory protein
MTAAPSIPVSLSTWWDGVKTGRFPQPVKPGPRITAWRVEDIRELIARFAPKHLPERSRK